MRPKSMILILIALGCGLVASIGISQVIERNSGEGETQAETSPIYVAMVNVPIGLRLNAQNVRLEEWPVDKIPEGAVTSFDEMEELVTSTRLFAGEPILRAKLSKHGKGASVFIPAGYRVVAVKVSTESVSGGLIEPGDKVDVLVFLKRRPQDGLSTTRTFTLLTNVTVYAVNQKINRDYDEDKKQVSAKTVSLLVEPKNVERLMLADELGEIRLSLRNSDDDVAVDGENGTDLRDILTSVNGAEELEMVQDTALGSEDNGVLNLMNSIGSDEPVAEDVFTMEVVTGDGVVVYRFDDLNRLPRELVNGSEAEEPNKEPTDFGDTEASDSEAPQDVDLEELFSNGDAEPELSEFDN